jgi:hypothetical protein
VLCVRRFKQVEKSAKRTGVTNERGQRFGKEQRRYVWGCLHYSHFSNGTLQFRHADPFLSEREQARVPELACFAEFANVIISDVSPRVIFILRSYAWNRGGPAMPYLVLWRLDNAQAKLEIFRINTKASQAGPGVSREYSSVELNLPEGGSLDRCEAMKS